MKRGTAPRGQWARTATLASMAFLVISYLLVLLIGGAYSNFVDGHPLWGVECLVLAAIPFAVAAETYRRGSRRQMSAGRKVRVVSAALILAGLVVAVVAVFLSAPI